MEQTKRKSKPKSPTARALEDLRKLGFVAAVVEKWNPHVKIRQDLFGCIDIVAIHPQLGTFGIQATSNNGGHHAEHVTKALKEPRLRTWLQAGNRYEIFSYAMRGGRDERKTYQLRRQEITLDHLPLP